MDDHGNQAKRRRVPVYPDEAFEDDTSSNINRTDGIYLPVLPSIGARVKVKHAENQNEQSCIIMSGIQAGLYSGKILVKYNDGSMGHVDPDDLQVAAVAKGGLDMQNETDQHHQFIPPPQAPPGSLMAQLQELRQRKEQVATDQVTATGSAQPRIRHSETQAGHSPELNSSYITPLNQSQSTASAKTIRGRGAYTDFATLSNADELSKLYNHRTVTCISCGDKSTIMIHKNGDCNWTPGLPPKLAEKLQIRRETKQLPTPTYVAIGSHGRYYIRYDNGDADWHVCDTMSKELFEEKQTNRSISSVAFGSEWDSFFIVYDNGGVCFDEVPEGLIEVMASRQGRAGSLKPDCVSLGPRGEYFMSTTDGRCWWGGLETAAAEKIQQIEKEHGIAFLDFGADGSYCIEYGSASNVQSRGI